MALLALVFTMAAAPPDQSLVLAKIDTDHDGTISLKEATVAAKAKFAALDTDKDDKLNASELIGIMGRAQMNKADSDKDVVLDQAEYLAVIDALFKEADADHDGTLQPDDLSTEKGRELVAMLNY